MEVGLALLSEFPSLELTESLLERAKTGDIGGMSRRDVVKALEDIGSQAPGRGVGREARRGEAEATPRAAWAERDQAA